MQSLWDVSGNCDVFVPNVYECGQSFPLLVEHILTAQLEFFSFLAFIACNLPGCVANLRHRVFHRLSCLIAQFDAFVLDLGACLLARLWRQQQYYRRASQSTQQHSR
jgi:hypothetical protein